MADIPTRNAIKHIVSKEDANGDDSTDLGDVAESSNDNDKDDLDSHGKFIIDEQSYPTYQAYVIARKRRQTADVLSMI